MSSDEAREIAAGNPLSFLRVSKPEIDLPRGIDPYAPEVYAKGRENFQRLISEGALIQDSEPCFYFYRQRMGQHEQVGLAAVASCEDYSLNIIRKHELTRVDKEDDRVRHIETLHAQTGPAFLVYRTRKTIDEIALRAATTAPAIDFTAKDGVQHTAWVVADPVVIETIRREFERTPTLYIADGHHRSAAATRVWKRWSGAGESAFFLSVIFPDSQVRILPYNRVLKDLNGLSTAQFEERLGQVFLAVGDSVREPTQKHDVTLYFAGKWRTLRFRSEVMVAGDPVQSLDADLLQRLVLKPIFGIDDPRTSSRISFVGGIRGPGELQKLVDSGEYACAFALYPTSVADLMSVADSNGIMPPKSTWFEPKLRDAMFCHLL